MCPFPSCSCRSLQAWPLRSSPHWDQRGLEIALGWELSANVKALEAQAPSHFSSGSCLGAELLCESLPSQGLLFNPVTGIHILSTLSKLIFFFSFFRSGEHGTLWSLIIAKLILSRSVSPDEVKRHYRRKEGYSYLKCFSFVIYCNWSPWQPPTNEQSLMNRNQYRRWRNERKWELKALKQF